jgi:hypothetical protein
MQITLDQYLAKIYIFSHFQVIGTFSDPPKSNREEASFLNVSFFTTLHQYIRAIIIIMSTDMDQSNTDNKRKADAISASHSSNDDSKPLPLLYVNDLSPAVPPLAEDLHIVVKVEENEQRKIQFKNGKGSLFSVILLDRDNTLVDAKNRIKLTVFSSNAKNFDTWFNLLTTGAIVRIWLGKLKPINDPRFNKTGHKYELSLTEKSTIDVIDDATVKREYWTFGGKRKRSVANITCPISELVTHTPQDAKAVVDPVTLLGIVIHCTQMEMGSKNGNSWQKSKVVLGDATMFGVEVTFWGKFAEMSYDVGKVLLIENAKISAYNTCTLSSGSTTNVEVITKDNMATMLIKELHETVGELESWFDDDTQELSKFTSEFNMLSKYDRNSKMNKLKIRAQAEKSHIGTLNARSSDAKIIIRQGMLNSDSGFVDSHMYQDDGGDASVSNSFKPVSLPPDVVSQVQVNTTCVKATIARILVNLKRPITVPCCDNEIPVTNNHNGAMKMNATKLCGKYVTSDPRGWACAACHTTQQTCTYSYNITFEISDAFGSCTITIFNDAVKSLVSNVSAKDMIISELRGAPIGVESHVDVNQLLVDRISQQLNDREFIFVLKSSADAYRGLKFSCDVVDEVDYDKESEELMMTLV